MNDGKALQSEIGRRRAQIIQLRLMLKHVKPGRPADIAAVRSRLSTEVNQLKEILKARRSDE